MKTPASTIVASSSTIYSFASTDENGTFFILLLYLLKLDISKKIKEKKRSKMDHLRKININTDNKHIPPF
jgi:hypothetical protein